MPQHSDLPGPDQVPAAPEDVHANAVEAGPDEGRLHPAAMAVWGISHVGGLAALLIAGTVDWRFLAVALVVGGGGVMVWWSRFHWRIEPDAFVIEQGLFQRRRRVIPFERIQAVDVGRKLRHRIFGVVELHVETVGGDKTEGRLDALDPDTARRLRARLLRLEASGGQPAPLGAILSEEPGELLARMGPGDLIVAGLTGGRVGVAAVIFGFAQQAFGNRLQRGVERLPDLVGPGLLVGFVAFAALVIFAISVIATAVTYWDFTLRRDGTNLRIRRGLLNQRLDTIPLRRIQAVRIDENLVRRAFGFATVKVVVAGRAAGNQARDTGVLLPLARREDAHRLVEAVFGRQRLATVPVAAMPAAARTRRYVRAGAAVAVVTVALVVAFGWIGLAGLAAGVPALWLAEASYRALGHGQHDDMVLARRGVFIRRTAYVPEASLQSLALTSTPLQRARSLATLELQIAHPPGTPDPALVDIDAEQGSMLLSELADAAANAGRERFGAVSG